VNGAKGVMVGTTCRCKIEGSAPGFTTGVNGSSLLFLALFGFGFNLLVLSHPKFHHDKWNLDKTEKGIFE
jgi:hypothetical protein